MEANDVDIKFIDDKITIYNNNTTKCPYKEKLLFLKDVHIVGSSYKVWDEYVVEIISDNLDKSINKFELSKLKEYLFKEAESFAEPFILYDELLKPIVKGGVGNSGNIITKYGESLCWTEFTYVSLYNFINNNKSFTIL